MESRFTLRGQNLFLATGWAAIAVLNAYSAALLLGALFGVFPIRDSGRPAVVIGGSLFALLLLGLSGVGLKVAWGYKNAGVYTDREGITIRNQFRVRRVPWSASNASPLASMIQFRASPIQG